jgi:hypothetical protein
MKETDAGKQLNTDAGNINVFPKQIGMLLPCRQKIWYNTAIDQRQTPKEAGNCGGK